MIELREYHRPYKLLDGTMTNTAIYVSHGKAEKLFLMDIASNGQFSEAEWHRYEQTLKVEKLPVPTHEHIRRKQLVLKRAREHIFTNEEISEIIRRKKAFNKNPANVALERLRLQQKLDAAIESKDQAQIDSLQKRISELAEAADQKFKSDTAHLELFDKLNEKRRENNFKYGREAEKTAMQQRKQKGTTDYDPFARRKTAPMHVINRFVRAVLLPTDAEQACAD
eukprot:jgi/Hompol1/5781/HPOL_004689-RA